MTRKHFEAAAAIVRAQARAGVDTGNTVEAMIALFVQFNQRFNVARFREACSNG
jgi:hypothetical protein